MVLEKRWAKERRASHAATLTVYSNLSLPGSRIFLRCVILLFELTENFGVLIHYVTTNLRLLCNLT